MIILIKEFFNLFNGKSGLLKIFDLYKGESLRLLIKTIS